jgi:hypothetical protein
MLRIPAFPVPHLLLAAILVALPVAVRAAGETRLAPGLRLTADGGLRLDLAGGLAIGVAPAADTVPSPSEAGRLIAGSASRRALGGSLELSLGAVRLGGALNGAIDGGRAELTASGDIDEDTSLILRWSDNWTGSALPIGQDPATVADGGSDLRLTLRHTLSPGLYVAGSAAAVSESRGATERSSSMLFGASVGLRF